MKITILHNAVSHEDSPADRDVLTQVEAVDDACKKLGHNTRRLACTLNLEAVEETLTQDRPDVVFNLVESLAGSDRLAHLAAVLLDDLDLAYSGAPAPALHLTNNKPLAKLRLRSAGLPTPDWVAAGDHSRQELVPPYIIKAVWEHASVGLDDHAVVKDGDGSTIIEQIASRARQLGRGCFAERFVEGREFNLSLLGGGEVPHVLPPAEIDFSAFPADKPRIVGFAAKWEEAAFEFAHTPRKFDFPESDAPLLDWLRSLALACWRLFDLRGYARVDFRVDAKGQPWILEVNANPCLSPDAGFAAALAQAQVPPERAIQWILEDARRERAAVDGSVLAPTPDYSAESPPPAPARRPPKTQAVNAELIETSSASTVRMTTDVKLRSEVRLADSRHVRRLVESCGLFRANEVDVAVELVEAFLAKGPASGYSFLFAQQGRQVLGYACFGKNTVTLSSYDLYWIAVEQRCQGRGIGRQLLEEAERQIAAAGGTRIYIETSHRADYQATRGFYERCGYRLEGVLEDYYAPGDSKAVYVKTPSRAE